MRRKPLKPPLRPLESLYNRHQTLNLLRRFHLPLLQIQPRRVPPLHHLTLSPNGMRNTNTIFRFAD